MERVGVGVWLLLPAWQSQLAVLIRLVEDRGIDSGEAPEEQEEEAEADHHQNGHDVEHISTRHLLHSSQNSKELRKQKVWNISTFCFELIWLLPRNDRVKLLFSPQSCPENSIFLLRNLRLRAAQLMNAKLINSRCTYASDAFNITLMRKQWFQCGCLKDQRLFHSSAHTDYSTADCRDV